MSEEIQGVERANKRQKSVNEDDEDEHVGAEEIKLPPPRVVRRCRAMGRSSSGWLQLKRS